ncbi:MAG: AAA family ATPase [Desulfurococcaceae archaeon]
MSSFSNEVLGKYVSSINRFKSELEKPFIGRGEEALVITLALMTSEHVVLIGEPGTAKSALARRAADLLRARFFKYLLTKYTEPDELFGSLDILAFKVGKYVRVTKNKLPEAEIAFLDEIFNASSAILNTLLTLLNERVIYDGYNEISVPLWTLISASNTVPEEQEYQALYDRFLFRQFVKPVSEDKWLQLVEASWKIEKEGYRAPQPVLSMEDLKYINSIILSIDVSKVKHTLIKMYAVLEDQGIHLTDRRKGKVLKTIAAHALLNGRTTAVEEDLAVLKYVAPSTREEAEKVYIILLEELGTRERLMSELQEIEDNLREVKALLLKTKDFDPRLVEYLRGLEKARERINRIIESTTDDNIRARSQDILAELTEVIDEVRRRLLV